MNKSVLFIANNANGKPISDGQHAKTRMWISVFEKEHIEFSFLELDNWKKHVFSLVHKLKKQIKKHDIILLMASAKGSRMLIPIINHINRKLHKRFVYVFIGSGPLSKLLLKLPPEKANDFVINHTFFGKKDTRMGKEIKKVDVLLAETNLMTSLVNDFYKVDNCHTLHNFRLLDDVYSNRTQKMEGALKIIYASRLCKDKGIFDLLDAVIIINSRKKNIKLDIFGGMQFSEKEKKDFFDRINSDNSIAYKGVAESSEMLNLLSKYDMMAFPTRYSTESVPGIIAESLIVGVPIISSNYPQRTSILTDMHDSVSYAFCSTESLIEKLNFIISNRQIIKDLSDGAMESGKKYIYKYCRENFFALIFGSSSTFSEGK